MTPSTQLAPALPAVPRHTLSTVRVRLGALAARWTVYLRIVMFAVAFRVISASLAVASNAVFPLAQPEQFTVLARTNLVWDAFARYDSGWYFGIARYGYQYVESGRSNLAFFPL